jgi:hypothetical protein
VEPWYRKEKHEKRAENYHIKSQYILSPRLLPALKNITQKWRRYVML